MFINLTGMADSTFNKKVIVINSNTLWSVYNFRSELIKFLINKNFKVFCVGSEILNFGMYADALRSLGAEVEQVSISRRGFNIFQDIRYIVKLYRIYKRIKPAVVLHFTPKPNIYGSLVCRILEIKTICTINGLGTGILSGSIIVPIQKLLYKISLKHAAKVFFQNHDDKSYFLTYGLIRDFQADYIPGSGINLDHYVLPAKEIVMPLKFLFAGRLIGDKGLYEYVEAASQIISERKDAEFYMVGFIDTGNPTGISRQYLESLSSGGFIMLEKTEDIRSVFSMADVVVLPSYREGLSRLLLEASSCGKAVITSDVPGCRETVKYGNGLLCEARSVSSLRSAMEKMLDLPSALISEMGKKGRVAVAEHYSSETVNLKYLESLMQII